MKTTTKRYEVRINSTVATSHSRIDHAVKSFEAATKNKTEGQVELVDTKFDSVVKSMNGGKRQTGREPKVCVACGGTGKNSKGFECRICSPKAPEARSEKPAAPKAPKASRTTERASNNNGDAIAEALVGMTAKDIAPVAVKIFALICKVNEHPCCKTELRRNRELAMIHDAANRENVGSGRMSLGLTLRKYVKIAGLGVVLEMIAEAK
jgi:hypothetical protein